jgi:hypothetical protein
VGSATSHHAVDSAGDETRHRVYPLWFIAPFLLSQTLRVRVAEWHLNKEQHHGHNLACVVTVVREEG